MKAPVLLLALCLAGCSVPKQSVTVTGAYLGLFSWHNKCDNGCNQNNNPVVGVDFEHSTGKYTAVAYPNSHSKGSFLAAKREKYFFYGAVTGYHQVFPIPFIAPIISIGPVDFSCLSDFKTTVCMGAIKSRFE